MTEYTAKEIVLVDVNGNYLSPVISHENKDLKKSITNCLTEIPQRIKLELNNGTLTLKAGSQVIVPNGFEEDDVTPKFDEVEIENDVTNIFPWGSSGTGSICYGIASGVDYILGATSERFFSGNTAPTDYPTMIWYDTSNNLVKRTFDSGATWDYPISLPVGIITWTGSSSNVTSINQIFNGMGYIGSTVFVGKGVKGLIPNGRNADGSLKNIEFTTTGVKTFSVQNAEKFVLNIYDGSIGIDISTYSYRYYFIQKDMPTGYSGNYAIWYDTENNIIKYTENAGSVWTKVNLFNCALGSSGTGGTITSLTTKTTFRAIDYSDNQLPQIDGQWIRKSLTLASTTSAGTFTYDLSEYLPDTNHIYEIRIHTELVHSGATGDGVNQYIYSDVITGQDSTVRVGYVVSGSTASYDTFTLPAKQYIYVYNDANRLNRAYVLLSGYRRLGTNQ